MSVDLKVPSLGESVQKATVEKWLKKQGEFVKRDEPLVSLESDKANVEVPAPVGGVLQEIVKAAGATVAIGEVLARIEPATMRYTREQLQGKGAASATSSSATSSSATSATAPATPPPAPTAPVATAAELHDHDADGHDAHLPPSLRRLAREHNLDLRAIPASGPAGRLLPQDVQRELARLGPVPQAPVAAPASPAPAPSTVRGPAPARELGARAEERVPMTSLRKRIAERLVEGRKQAAILTTFNECDMTRVMELREEHKERFATKHGIKLGFMSFFVKAAIEGLKAFPEINAEIQGDEIVYHNYYDVGVAVGGGKGLVVPVIRNAERLSFAEVEKTLDDLAKRAKDNKLTPDELKGGTFTISNGGVYGSLLSTPLLNPPQSGILGMHSIQKRAVVVKDAVVVRPMMYLALSYDHRIVDGREAVQFLVRVKECIEAPDRILLEV